ncbi:cell division cycle-associated protein 2 isoform X2 [Paramormyrops kingsleyae]|uniref:cell division cycle-associated protein 2 isoform X2 n=1 Tax=Paramormyrops kingsleyae TaxID=1676925 RepID=UPI000CD5E70B|nr:cell division cycle-associated protein 2 isoform X2 [Paramormyrops kingsleyae]
MEDVDVLGQAMAGSPEKNPPLDFSRVTPSLFGISTESFIPSSRKKDKSRLSQLKARRRSTIGVRGSPETNSLIRYIAQQKCRTPPSLPPSPFIGHGFSSLRQKMASFQSLLEIDEVPKAELLPAVEWTEVSNESSAVTAKENMDPHGCLVLATPPSYKKPRMECVQVSPHFPMFSSLPVPGAPVQHPGPPLDAVVPDCPELEYAICESPLSCSAADPGGFDPKRLPPAEAQQARSAGPTWPDSNGLHKPDEPSAPRNGSLMFLSPPADHSTSAGEVTAAADVPLSTKKRVRFGVPLTPELFDMMLPPSTPLQRGGTPARLIASAGPQLRSLLKTPHRSPQHFPQPDFGSPSETREAPAEMQFDQAEHNRQDDECPQVSLLDVTEDSESTLSSADVAPSQIASCQPQSEMIPPVMLRDSLAGTHPESEPPSALEEPPIDTAPACSRGRKRKTSKSLTTRERASRTAAVCASQKIKGSSRKKHWGSKEVDRSLYGKRDYASKNPTLSPISEAVLSASSSPAPQPDHSREQPSGEMERPALEVPDATPGPRGSDLTASAITAAAMWRKRFCPRTEGPSKVHSDDMAGGTLEEEGPSSGLDQQGSRGCRRRPGVGCMVAIEMEPADGTDEALSISPTHSSGPGNPLEESTQVNSNPHKEGGDADWHMLQECSEPGTDSDTVAPPQVGGSLSEISVNKMIKRSRKRKGWGGNSHRRSGRLQDSQVHMLAEEQMPAQQVPDPSLSGAREEARWEGGAVMGVPSADSSEVSQDAGRTDQGLPWQLPDFSIDDVLQHPSRGRRSVRRSLRNHANTDPSEGGLAWVLETSPDLSVNRSLRRGSKRWTRPTLPEEAGL